MMTRTRVAVIGLTAALATSARGQAVATSYPSMAPIEQYRMTRAAEIALAKSAAPDSIANDATVLVLGASGYERAATGKNGFVCVVERSWANDFGNADFWNPKVRGPICFNAAAARSVLADYLNRTTWVLAGLPTAAMEARSRVSTPAVGAMCYMLSQDGYLGDNVGGPWHPHLMFFLPRTPAAAWGANVAHSPVRLYDAAGAAYTTFLVVVEHWSGGARDSASVN